jgi:hypothetical protein
MTRKTEGPLIYKHLCGIAARLESSEKGFKLITKEYIRGGPLAHMA